MRQSSGERASFAGRSPPVGRGRGDCTYALRSKVKYLGRGEGRKPFRTIRRPRPRGKRNGSLLPREFARFLFPRLRPHRHWRPSTPFPDHPDPRHDRPPSFVFPSPTSDFLSLRGTSSRFTRAHDTGTLWLTRLPPSRQLRVSWSARTTTSKNNRVPRTPRNSTYMLKVGLFGHPIGFVRKAIDV